MTENSTLDDLAMEPMPPRRRKLIPVYIRVFCFIFMAFSIVIPIGLLFSLIGKPYQVSLYGLSSSDPASLTGLSILALFTLKGAAGFGLWFEKDWGPKVAKADAILGIILCIVLMAIQAFQFRNAIKSPFSFRLELFLLVPYYISLLSLAEKWNPKTDQKA
jgi:hypothetical protein